jgi:membrane protein implicated in regulation of membrane protease activity
MSRVDWPLALTLVFVFVVMSAVRWRYFMRRAARLKREATKKGTPD